MELRSGKIASYSRKKNETKSKAPSSKQTVTKPKKDSIPKKAPVKKNVKQKTFKFNLALSQKEKTNEKISLKFFWLRNMQRILISLKNS